MHANLNKTLLFQNINLPLQHISVLKRSKPALHQPI